MMRPEDGADARFDELMASYRDACPVPEASPDFMPRLWQKIEARQRFTVQLRHWAQGFLTAAVAASLVIALLQVTPPVESPVYSATYVEALADEQASDRLVFQDVAFADNYSDARPASWNPQQR